MAVPQPFTFRRRGTALGVLAVLVTTFLQAGTSLPAHAGYQDNPRSAPTTFDTGTAYDLAGDYIINWGDAKYASNDANQIEKSHLDAAGNLFILKQRYDLTRWEQYRLTSTTVDLVRDTTAPAGNPGNSYDQSGGWMPRYWTVGREVANNITNHWFDKNTCRYTQHQTLKDGVVRKYLRYQGPLNVGGDFGVQDVTVVDVYFYLDANPGNEFYWNPTEAERFWYVRGRGWVRWEWFADRTAGGSRWNAGNTWDLENSGANTKVYFNKNWGSGNSLRPTPVCTGGVY